MRADKERMYDKTLQVVSGGERQEMLDHLRDH